MALRSITNLQVELKLNSIAFKIHLPPGLKGFLHSRPVLESAGGAPYDWEKIQVWPVFFYVEAQPYPPPPTVGGAAEAFSLGVIGIRAWASKDFGQP